MFKLNISSFKLSALLDEINFLFEFQCIERRISFKIVCDPDIIDCFFESDSKRIKQVIINLVSNSIKFTEKGGIIIRVSRFKTNNEIFLKFKVKDTGIGINQSDIPKLFNKFSMLQKHMKLNACGSGIGLSISKMIAESLGGKISVKSEEGEWTEFKFTIKLHSDNFMIREEVKEIEMLHHEEIKEVSREVNFNIICDSIPDISEVPCDNLNQIHANNLSKYEFCDASVSREVFKSKKKID